MLILGIETSCDETAAAVVRDGTEILSNVVRSQEDLHRAYGGVVPEIACRAHVEGIVPIIDQALRRAEVQIPELDGIAVTNRPGLIGALLVGLTAAKALAWLHALPLVTVNHVEAHAYANRLATGEICYPFVCLVVSGGHTLICNCKDELTCEVVGSTIDDAAGEAFDKVASILGLGYPGGPVIDKTAREGDADAIGFPRSYLGKGSHDFSFSGLKTAVLYHCCGQDAKQIPATFESRKQLADVAASFQEAVVEVLVAKTLAAAEALGAQTVAMGGGVACNSRLREEMQSACAERSRSLYYPPLHLCTDNAAMIAGLGCHALRAGETAELDVDACPQYAPRAMSA